VPGRAREPSATANWVAPRAKNAMLCQGRSVACAQTATPSVTAILGSPYPPWRPIGEADVAHVLDEITARGPRVVALSGHDSTPWTCQEFGRRFGDRYRTLRVGEELRVSAEADRAA
jgi:hypothetical protein